MKATCKNSANLEQETKTTKIVTYPLLSLASSIAASRNTRPDSIMISRCQGDDTFVTFQPMGIFHFWRNREFPFFPKMFTAPLFFLVLTCYLQVPWSNKNIRKQRAVNSLPKRCYLKMNKLHLFTSHCSRKVGGVRAYQKPKNPVQKITKNCQTGRNFVQNQNKSSHSQALVVFSFCYQLLNVLTYFTFRSSFWVFPCQCGTHHSLKSSALYKSAQQTPTVSECNVIHKTRRGDNS